VGERYISEAAVVASAGTVREAGAAAGVALTFFEIATMMAFLEFRAADVEIAVVEVGLGGRLDVTNVVESVATAITSIDLDHCAYLGPEIGDIAREKAGIIRRGVPLVTGPLSEAAAKPIASRAHELGAPWLCFGRDFDVDATLEPALPGAHQLRNAAVATTLARTLDDRFGVDERAIHEGIAVARWPGRFETVARHPTVIFDGAHNPHAAGALVEAVDQAGLGCPRILVFGVMADKDWPAMLRILCPSFDHVVLVPVSRERALDPHAADREIGDLTGHHVAVSLEAGLNEARAAAGAQGAVVVAGSIFLIGEAYGVLGLGAEWVSDAVVA
jgi:dihydrofolate synthase/folylpolyglutamate synthase